MAHIGTRTLIAVAVAAASTYTGATTFDVSGADRIEVNPAAYEQVVLEGQAVRSQDGIDFDTPHVQGDFINNADFNLSGAGVDAIGIDTDEMDGRASIGGSFINNGSINANGQGAYGILISDTNIGESGARDDDRGNVINKGTISITDTSGKVAEDVQGGITIEHSHLAGDVINAGTISVDAVNAHGISLDGSRGSLLVERDVINKGAIQVRGKNAKGLVLDEVTLGNRSHQLSGTDLINSGTISVEGQNSRAAMLDDTTFNTIENTGNLRAQGEGSVGLLIHDSESAATRSLTTSGNIHGDEAGIRVTDRDEKFHHWIVMDGGTISSLNNAIEGNGNTDLDINGGTIIGDVSGIVEAFVAGQVTVHSSVFDTKHLDVSSGNLYFAEIHSNVTGDMNVSSGAGVTVRVADSADTNKGLVQVGGKAVLEKGSIVSVHANNGEYTQSGRRYVLIRADQLQDLGALVVSATPLLTVTGAMSDNKNLSAHIALATGDEALGGLERMGLSQNTVRATKAFLDGVMANLPTDSNLYQSFINADEAQLTKLANQLNPEVNGGSHAASMAASGLTTNAVTSRAAAVGVNSGDALVDTGAWVKVLDGNTDQSARGGVAGFDADSQGIVIGADGKIDTQTTIGFAYGHVKTDVDSDTGNKTDVTSHMFTAYGAWEDGPMSVIGSLSYGISDNESTRYVAGERAKADYDSKTLSADVIGGYKIELDDKFSVQPQLGARYTRVKIDSFTEKGTAAALSTGSQNIEVFDIGAGFQFGADLSDFKPFGADLGNLKPSARVMAYRDLARDSAQTTSAFVLGGNTFVTNGADATKWTYEAGLGLDWSKDNYTVSMNYDYARKADFNADTLALTFRWDF